MEQKYCSGCEKFLDIDRFQLRTRGDRGNKRYRTSKCRICKSRRSRVAKKLAGYDIAYRQRPDKRALVIKGDCRGSDQKRGWKNDLDVEFVKSLIKLPCSYCGVYGKMTLDRVNNAIGHLKSNVVTACVSCNYFRRDMPYEAWLEIVPGIVNALSKGLLPGWGTVAFRCR